MDARRLSPRGGAPTPSRSGHSRRRHVWSELCPLGLQPNASIARCLGLACAPTTQAPAFEVSASRLQNFLPARARKYFFVFPPGKTLAPFYFLEVGEQPGWGTPLGQISLRTVVEPPSVDGPVFEFLALDLERSPKSLLRHDGGPMGRRGPAPQAHCAEGLRGAHPNRVNYHEPRPRELDPAVPVADRGGGAGMGPAGPVLAAMGTVRASDEVMLGALCETTPGGSESCGWRPRRRPYSPGPGTTGSPSW